jgi:hypothetical protein
VEPEAVQRALQAIRTEADPTVRNLEVAALCSAMFRDRGMELVVVGGSAIEFYTEGAYVSGDVDLCRFEGRMLSLRERQEVMSRLEAEGGPRNWKVGGVFVDLLGDLENLARSPVRTLETPHGLVRLAPAEELLVERILVATYPREYAPARDCARKLMAAALLGELVFDWTEAFRIAALPAYGVTTDLEAWIDEQAKALAVRNPRDSHA